MDIPNRQPAMNNDTRNPWHPGAFARFPWPGGGALLGALGGIAASIAILIVSNNVPITKWGSTFQPTVYLSIASTVTNIFIHFAFAEGITIAWWRRSLQPGTHVADLHRYWDFGNSLLSAVTGGRNFNFVSLASILVAIAPINGPLLQRASSVVMRPITSSINLAVPLAPQLPGGFSGMLSGRGEIPALFSAKFSPVVSDYSNRAKINMTGTDCDGICSAIVTGVGFSVNCSGYEDPFSLVPVTDPDGSFNTSQQAVYPGTRIFGTDFAWFYESPGSLDLNIQYKATSDCEGNLMVKNCTLNTATVQYSIVIDSNQSTVALAPGSTIYDDEVLSINDVALNTASGPTTLGGIWLALNNKVDSTANIRFVGARGYELTTSGATANEFAILNASDSTLGTDCNLSFDDPTDTMLATAREIMFRASVAAANSSNIQHVQGLQVSSTAVYVSHYLYLGLAAFITALAILFILPTFGGYWKLGRKVTMSPLEVAKAFNAPLLKSKDSNAEAEVLLKEVGDRSVQYGTVNENFESGMSPEMVTSREHSHLLYHDNALHNRLVMASSKNIQIPQQGWTFSR